MALFLGGLIDETEIGDEITQSTETIQCKYALSAEQVRYGDPSMRHDRRMTLDNIRVMKWL